MVFPHCKMLSCESKYGNKIITALILITVSNEFIDLAIFVKLQLEKVRYHSKNEHNEQLTVSVQHT